MQITVPREILVKALSRVQGILTRASNNPTLACVLLQARAGKLKITATDTLITLVAEYDVTVEREDELLVDGQVFFQVAKAAPPGEVMISTVSTGRRLRVAAGSSVAHLNTASADDFPPMVSTSGYAAKTLTLSGGDLARLIDQTHYAIATDENRYGLNGAHLHVVQGAPSLTLRMVATDGTRLGMAEASFTGELGLERKALLSRKGLGELRKLIDGADQSWTVTFERNCISYATAGLRLVTRVVDGEFPDYQQVLPAEYRRRITVARRPLEDAIRRINLFATDKSHTAAFNFQPGMLVITGENIDRGDGREEVPCDLEGEPIRLGFNTQYWLDLLGATRGDLVIEVGAELDPTIIKIPDDPQFKGVIMPLRMD